MAKRPDDDLFSESTMSFGEHLEELRKTLIKALWGLMAGMIIGLVFANDVVDLIQRPLLEGLREYELKRAIKDLEAQDVSLSPELITTIEQLQMTPSEQFVDPSELLRQLHIEQAGSERAAAYSPSRIGPDDLVAGQVPALCRQLEREGLQIKSRADLGGLIWPNLSPADQDLIGRLAQAGQVTAADRQALAGVFSRLAGNRQFLRQLYDAEDDSLSVSLAEQDMNATLTRLAHQVADEDSATGEDAQRLVRLLLAKAYPDAIEPYVLPLVPMTVWEPMDVAARSLGTTEVFMIWLKAGIVTGFIIASPWIFWHMWSFVAAGLYPHEKHYVHIYLPFSLALFAAGVLLAYNFVFSFVLGFLFDFNLRANIPIDPRISEWVSFVLILPLGFGLSFQLPLVMLFLERIGLFEVKDYLAKWRIAVVVIFVISMLLTPADPMSMILMAMPLTGLYFLGVALCKWMPRRRNPYAELDEA